MMEVPITGSIAVYVKASRTAKWPNGRLFWEEFREVEQPANEADTQRLYAERFRHWSQWHPRRS